MKMFQGIVLGGALLLMTSQVFADETGNPLQLDSAAMRAEGIESTVLQRRPLAPELKAPGEVRANAYATVLVSPRVTAQVVKRHAKLGDDVHAGQPLVTLSSVEVADVQGALIVAEQEWQRVSSLGPQAVSGRRYTEVKVRRDQARAKLRAYGLTGGQINNMLKAGSAYADGSFELLSPAAGRVTSDDFTVGEQIAPGRTLFTLVDEGSVWVEAQLSPTDAAKIQLGDPARVVAHGQNLKGKVVQLAHQASEKTRTVPVRVQVDNREDLLHNGEFVDVWLANGQPQPTLALPGEAVVLLSGQSTVFVDQGQGRYAPVAVRLGESHGGMSPVLEGLREGERVVVKGAFVLKARLLKSQIGGEGH